MADRTPSRGHMSTQSKYYKVRKDSKNEPSQIEPNEVRITTSGKVKKYVDYAEGLLKGRKAEDDSIKKFDTIVLKATGRAINHAVTTAEVVKRNVGGLHQVTSLETLEIEDVWMPKEEGLKEVKTTRRVASITITLSRDEAQIDRNAPGYQEPIGTDPLHVRRGRGRGRPGRGARASRANNRRRYPNAGRGMRGRRPQRPNNRSPGRYGGPRGGYGGYNQRRGGYGGGYGGYNQRRARPYARGPYQ